MQARLVVVLLFLVACGGPSAGETCMPFGGAICDTTHTKGALFCEAVFVAYDCPGPNGCTMSSSRVVCDFHGVAVGSSCPVSQIDKGFCDGKTLYRCNATTPNAPGSWSTMNCANSCAETATTFTCN